MLDCQVPDPMTKADGGAPPARKGVCFGVTQRMEMEREKKEQQVGPDPWAVRKFAVGLVFAVFAYSYYVFVVRVALRMVRMSHDRLGNRAQGIAYLAVYHILFCMFVWSYLTAISTPPGFARDFVPQSDPPKEQANLVEVEGYRFEDQPLSPHRHTSAEHLHELSRPSSEAPRTSTDTTVEPRRESMEDRRARSQSSFKASMNKDVPPLPVPPVPPLPPLPPIPLERTSTSTHPKSPTTKSFASTSRSSKTHKTHAPSTSATSLSNPPTFPLAYPPKARAKKESSGSSPPRGSASSTDRSFLHFPPPPDDYEKRPRLLVDRIPPQVPTLSEDYRYDPREGIMRPYRSHRCKHCGHVVLKMDHHCPWVGTCVGAKNYKFFYNFLQWSTAYTIFVFIALIAANTLPLHTPRRSHPGRDGEQVAIIAVAGFFSFFTGALFWAHTRLILLNMTTIEEMGFARMRGRERAALSRVYGFTQFRAKSMTKARWNEEWGRLGKEGNLWWLGSRRANWVSVMGENKLGWFLPVPAGPIPDDGLSYVPNPRFSPEGLWRRRKEWPRELQ